MIGGLSRFRCRGLFGRFLSRLGLGPFFPVSILIRNHLLSHLRHRLFLFRVKFGGLVGIVPITPLPFIRKQIERDFSDADPAIVENVADR